MRLNLFGICLGVTWCVIAYAIGGGSCLIGAVVGMCVYTLLTHDNSDRRRR